MNEDFLHYLWKYRLLAPELSTVTGESLVVLNPGEHNRDGGPDFFNARVSISGTTWAGNVEIHLKASDWYRHRHQHDPAYDNVILHAVFENDLDVRRSSDETIPALEIKGHFPAFIYEKYKGFQKNRDWVPCYQSIGSIDPFILRQWIPALAVERMEERILVLNRSLEASRYDWDETFYRNLARAFGFRINAQPFELLARSLPWKILEKHRTNLFQLEALLFGQAGMLDDNFTEDYPRLLCREYRFLKEKYQLTGIPGSLWKFLRLRPSNFPAIRIAQFAALINKQLNLFSAAIGNENPDTIIRLFDAKASSYWDTHFIFGKLSTLQPKTLGINSIRLLIVNLLAPFLFLYGEAKCLHGYKEKSIQVLSLLPPENNAIIDKWKESGLMVDDSLHTQALLHLKSNYCDKKRCLECRVGVQLMR